MKHMLNKCPEFDHFLKIKSTDKPFSCATIAWKYKDEASSI